MGRKTKKLKVNRKIFHIILISTFIVFCHSKAYLQQTDFKKNLPQLIHYIEKGDSSEKQAALNKLWFLYRPEFIKENQAFDNIIDLLLNNDPVVRQMAASYLGNLEDIALSSHKKVNFHNAAIAKNKIVPALIKATNDNDPYVRREVCKALGIYQDDRAVDPLLVRLQDKDLTVRLEAVYALGELKTQRAVEPLLMILEGDLTWPNKLVQQESIIALRKIRPMAEIVINSLMTMSEDEYLQAELIKMFGSYKAEASREFLLSATESHDDVIRALALAALTKLPPRQTYPDRETKRPMSISLLFKSSRDPSSKVRLEAAKSLGEIGTDQAIKTLIGMLDDADIGVKKKVITVLFPYQSKKVFNSLAHFIAKDKTKLKKFGSEQYLKMSEASSNGIVFIKSPNGGGYNIWKNSNAVTAIINNLDKADNGGKTELVRLLGFFHDERISAILEELIDTLEYSGKDSTNFRSSEDQTMRWAVWSLGRMPKHETISTLIDQLSSPNPRVRQEAAKGLGKLKNQDAFMLLLKTIEDENAQVRANSLEALNQYDDSRLIKINMRMLNDNNISVIFQALSFINKNPEIENIDPIINLMKDKNGNIACYAASTLGTIGDKKAIPYLISALNNEYKQNRRFNSDRDLRRRAAKSLGDLKADEAYSDLISIFKNENEDPILRFYEVAYALGEIGNLAALEYLEPALEKNGIQKDATIRAIKKLKASSN